MMTPEMKSRTERALAWISAAPAGEKRTVYAAAQRFELTPSVLYRAAAARKGRKQCPMCGQLLPRGKRIRHQH